MSVKTTIEIIGPDRAREILALNTANRAPIKNNLAVLCRAITAGEWQFNGDAIRISETNVLLDGQHRLMAIIETGIACQCLLIEGLKNKVFTTIDQGATRTFAHILSSQKVSNYTSAASVSNLLMQYNNGDTPARARSKSVSKDELLSFFYKNRDSIDTATSFCGENAMLRAWFSPSYLGMMHVIFSSLDKEDCEIFFTSLSSGVASDGRSQPIILREKLIRIISRPSGKENQLTRCAYAIFVWNNFRKNKKVTIVRWTRKGDNAQLFPRAQ